jgi:tetratricopeptide (TPR) repeat protein
METKACERQKLEMGDIGYRSAMTRAVFLGVLLVVGGSLIWTSGCRRKEGAQDWSPHYAEAVEAYRNRDYRKAVSLFEKALLYQPSNIDINLDIAGIYDDFLGDPAKAVSYYDKYLESATDKEKISWTRGWAAGARKRLAAASVEKTAPGTEPELTGDRDHALEELRNQFQETQRLLAEEKEKTKSLSERVGTLNVKLAETTKEQEELRERLAVLSQVKGESPPGKGSDGEGARTGIRPGWWRNWVTAGWLLSVCLGFLLVVLIVRQKSARAKDKALLASIQASASGGGEEIRKDDVLGKYYWVENDHSAGVLTFTERDDEIHVSAIDGTTRLRSRGKGHLAGNVLTAVLSSPGEEGVMTKFIFANKGRTLTAVWQGEEGTAVAAGTKEMQE